MGISKIKIKEIEFNEKPFEFNAHFSEIEFNINENFNNRYIKPPKTKDIPYKKLKYQKAVDLVKDIDFKELDRVFCIVSGDFIFGDFLEAFIVENNILIDEMIISTLSYSKDNIDSLHNLINGDYLKKLDIIVSDYFYAHERNKLIKETYEKLDNDLCDFQLSVAGTHCKTYQFKTSGGKHIIIHGSINLRSSSNIEQFIIEDNKDFYDFNREYQSKIIEKYKTINKSIRGNELFNLIK
jgi:hypothetical protein